MGEKVKGVVSYKRALISARAIMSDDSLESEKAEKFVSDISPFLTKKGEVRKNLSSKRKAEFNLLVSQYKGTNATPSVKKLKSREKKQLQGFKDSNILSNKNDTKTQKEHQKELVDMFKLKTVQRALKSGLISSDQIVDNIKSFKKVSGTAIVNAARAAKAELKRTLPKEAQKKIKADDYSGLLDDILNEKLDRYTEEDIPF